MFLEIFQNLKENTCNFIKKKTLAQVFSCEFFFFTEHLWVTASLHETFRKRLGFILNILDMFDVRFMSRGKLFLAGYTWVQTFCLKILFEHFVEILATSEFLKH